MPDTLRILTLNIWNYNPPWSRRRDLIVETVRQSDPDIIGFQEIRHSGEHDDGGKNQAQQLADRLSGYRYIYQPAQRNPERDQWEGLAIFSRLPFLSSGHIALSRDPDDPHDHHQRIVLYAECETAAGAVCVFNTHLSLSRAGRTRTVREIAACIAQRKGALPAILVGDFNETPDQPPIRHLIEEGGLIDAWAHAHPGEPGWTYTAENAYVRSRKDDRRGHRIDYIFTQPPLDGRGRVCACERIADRAADDGHFPSDHFGLTADISLKGRS